MLLSHNLGLRDFAELQFMRKMNQILEKTYIVCYSTLVSQKSLSKLFTVFSIQQTKNPQVILSLIIYNNFMSLKDLFVIIVIGELYIQALE